MLLAGRCRNYFRQNRQHLCYTAVSEAVSAPMLTKIGYSHGTLIPILVFSSLVNFSQATLGQASSSRREP